MNKKKIILSLLGCGACLISSNIINIQTSALTGSDNPDINYQLPGQNSQDNSKNQIDFSASQSHNLYNTRLQYGYFKDNTVHKSNPDVGGSIGRSTFDNLSGHKVENAIRTDYNFNMLFYIPSDFGVRSPGITVPENYYSSHNVADNFSTGKKESYYKKKKGEWSHSGKFNQLSHFNPADSRWIYESNPVYDKGSDDPIYDFEGDKWKGSTSNSSNIAIQPNTSDNHNGTKAKWNDDKFDRKLEWRYLGYSQQGVALGNPYFPSDSDSNGAGFDRGYMGARLSISNPTIYDDTNEWYAYSGKIQALKRLMNYDTSFNSARSKATDGGSTVSRPDAETWARGLSMITNPRTETPVFRLITASGGYSYVVAPPSKDLTGDMILTEMTEYDSTNKLIGSFTRDINTGTWNQDEYGTKDYSGVHPKSVVVGNDYTIKVKVYNSNDTSLQINPAKLDIGTAINGGARQRDFSDDDGNFYRSKDTMYTSLSKERTISGHSYATFEYKVTVPETATENFRMTGFINYEHLGWVNGQYTQVTDNKFTINDWGMNQYAMYHGDFVPSAIVLIDKNGQEVAQDMMQPGEDYKVKWEYTYAGPDRDKAYDLYFSGDIKRYLPQGSSDIKHYEWTENKKLKNGDKITKESEYITFEIPKVDVSSKVNEGNKYFLNETTSNDTAFKQWFGSWDIKISNLSVYPINDRPLKNEYITVGVKYDATLSAPAGLRGSGLEFDTTDTITIPDSLGGTKQIITHTHLKEGDNKNVTQVIQLPVKVITSGSTNVPINVYLNSDKRKYEDDLMTQSNNKATTSMKILPPNNPNNFNTGGNSFGCPINSEDNHSWDVTHQTLDFSGTRKNYSNFQSGKDYGFFYYPTEDTNSYGSETLDYNESYTVDYVKYKSKFTTDLNYGEKGWVNLMDSSQSEYAKIKAGYGYELDIQTTYKNDVFERQPEQTWDGVWNMSTIHDAVSSGNTGLRVSNTQTVANIHNDVYVRTSDGKVVSYTGMYGTSKIFKSTILKSDRNETVIRYEMIDKSTDDPMKIYVSEDTADGNYDLFVYTPIYKGVGSPVTKNDLCDHQELKFRVQGSMYDDNNEHIVQ